ncbi:META domain-containing protein [Halomonas organivorans]|uniref:Heat shock protein HslJ n=1 Tax=Halomonas organivorans TaxID=257772 RepID=A0A7W5G546_9GAMM|nr:META domain-containing protein [Halomonas organivorans]MBB3141063.1 heat shock protein HslJ [Halomonas organivorans]
MRRLFQLTYFLLLALWLAGCAALERSPDAEAALGELPASYRGELPCADCAGIRYHLSLFPDGVYTLKTAYLGAGEGRRFHERGEWALDASGDILTLNGGDQGPRQWRIEAQGGSLEMLDLEGHEIDSTLDYRLRRTPSFVTETLEDSYWKLIELDGEAVEVAEGVREPHLVFHGEQQRLTGFGGCNRLTGGYQREGEALSIGRVAATRMACMTGNDLEPRFLAMLEQVAGYRLRADRLELLDADGEVMARFEVRHLT